jgi:hypothetical protein
MLDAGGDPVERDTDHHTEREVLRPVYRHPQPQRPASRPVSVWIIALIVVTIGLLGAYVTITALIDAVDHGEDDEVVAAFGLGALLSAVQVATGVALFAGARWGRTGALTLCCLTIVFAAVGAMLGTVSSAQLAIGFAVNLMLIFALLGPQVYAWTGGDGKGQRGR